MPDLNKYIAPDAASVMRAAIAEANGREILFIGHTNQNDVVTKVDVLARGSEASVAAVTQFAAYGDVAIHNHPGNNLEPSDADVEVASLAACSGVASYIVNNDVNDVYVLVEPMHQPELSPLRSEKVTAVLAADGVLAKHLRNYEERPEQHAMMEEVVDAFNHDKISVVEAGTGTGKTLAYLVPAVAWALKNDERVVVSTHTINLQEQILHKDLPLVRKIMPGSFKAVLVKGRNNYICLRKTHAIEDDPELFEDENSAELQQVVEWAFATKTGDLSDLNFMPRRNVWEKVQASGETCFRARCPFFRECFVLRARREAATAQILVTNHALLFSDIAMRAESGVFSDSTILPKYNRVVFDEAHNIEEVATSHFGSSVSRGLCLRTLNLMYRRSKGRETGSLVLLGTQLMRCLGKAGDLAKVTSLFESIDKVAKTGVPALQFAVNDCFKDVAAALVDAHKDETGTVQYRITPKRRESAMWEHISERLTSLKKAARKFVSEAAKVTQRIGNLPLEDEKLLGALVGVNAHVDRLKSCADVLDAICGDPSEEFVNWLEARVSDTYIHASANRAPLTIIDSMISHVYEQFPTIIMTSATLTSRRKFDFWEMRTGLAEYKARMAGTPDGKGVARPVSELMLHTPFDYRKQAVMVIPTDVDVSFYSRNQQDDTQDHTLRHAVRSLLDVTKGGAFVLFTSYGLLRKTAREMRDELEAANMSLLIQGTENRDELLRRFRAESNAVLFGTDSFWAGVDVVGDALRSVIITKLPFRVPTEPIIEARTEYIEKHGGNSFLQYTVPMAVIKFRQGFGRLIRSKTDYGMVAVLDRRVIGKYYGKWFLQSLPECTQFVGPLEDAVAKAAAFCHKFRD